MSYIRIKRRKWFSYDVVVVLGTGFVENIRFEHGSKRWIDTLQGTVESVEEISCVKVK